MRYLTISEITYINGSVLNDSQLLSGKRKVRDADLLDASTARPAMSAFGADAYPDLSLKVAALLHALARNHPFTDGNKRTATVAAIFMFEVNGQRVCWQPEAALERIVALAEGQIDLATMAAWFPVEPTDAAPEPDAEGDMRRITRIINEHRWLLDELAGR